MGENKFRKLMRRIKLLEFFQGFAVAFCFWYAFPQIWPVNKFLAIITVVLPAILCIVSSIYEGKLEDSIQNDLMFNMKDVDEEMDEMLGLKKKWYQKAGNNATQIQIGIVEGKDDK